MQAVVVVAISSSPMKKSFPLQNVPGFANSMFMNSDAAKSRTQDAAVVKLERFE